MRSTIRHGVLAAALAAVVLPAGAAFADPAPAGAAPTGTATNGAAPAAAAPAIAAPAAAPAPAAPAAPDKLVILFGDGSASVDAKGRATLDQASRLYRAGNPIVMVVTGTTDMTGNADANFRLSERRAQNVLDGLVARGIPVAKLQLLAAGSTDPAVKGTGQPEPANRRAVITWR